MVEARPDHELIVAPEQLVAVGRLERTADRLGDRVGAIDGARNGTAQNVGDLQSILIKERSRWIAEAQARARDTGLSVADIAVDMLLPEAADVGVALDRPGVAEAIAAGRVQERELVLVGLRRGIDRAPAPIEQLDRRRRQRAEPIRRAGEVEMEFGVIAAHTDIRVDAAQLGGRALAPAIVVERVSRRVECDIVFLRADLRAHGTPPEGTDDALDLTSGVVEAVL